MTKREEAKECLKGLFSDARTEFVDLIVDAAKEEMLQSINPDALVIKGIRQTRTAGFLNFDDWNADLSYKDAT